MVISGRKCINTKEKLKVFLKGHKIFKIRYNDHSINKKNFFINVNSTLPAIDL